MIDVQLKAKHFFLIAELLYGMSAYDSFSTLETIKSGCSGSLDDDLITLSVDPNKLIYCFNILTYKPEGQYNRINSEMDSILLPQVQTGIQAGNEEWVYVGTQISETKTKNLALVDSLVANAKAKLYS
jgi:hypothetical protein